MQHERANCIPISKEHDLIVSNWIWIGTHAMVSAFTRNGKKQKPRQKNDIRFHNLTTIARPSHYRGRS